MAEVSLDHSYQELFQVVTVPMQSIVFRTEDMCQRYNQFIEASRSSQSGFPLLTPTMQARQHGGGGGGGLRDVPEYKRICCIQDHHHRNHLISTGPRRRCRETIDSQGSDGGVA